MQIMALKTQLVQEGCSNHYNTRGKVMAAERELEITCCRFINDRETICTHDVREGSMWWDLEE